MTTPSPKDTRDRPLPQDADCLEKQVLKNEWMKKWIRVTRTISVKEPYFNFGELHRTWRNHQQRSLSNHPDWKRLKKKTPISRLVPLFAPCVTSFGSGPAALAQQSARAATTATCPGPHYPICKSLSALTVATQSPKLLSVWQRNQASLKGLSVFVFSQMKSGSDECSVWLPPYLESSNQVPVARVFSANGFDGFYTFARAVFLSDLSWNRRSLVTFRCSPPDSLKLAEGLVSPQNGVITASWTETSFMGQHVLRRCSLICSKCRWLLCNVASSQSCYVAGITFTLTFTGNQPQALFFSCLIRNELLLSRLIRRDNTAEASHPTPTTAEPLESPAIKGRDGRLGDGRERERDRERRRNLAHLICFAWALL